MQTHDAQCLAGNEFVDQPTNQSTTAPPSIFSFYQATDRAPGSNLFGARTKLLEHTGIYISPQEISLGAYSTRIISV